MTTAGTGVAVVVLLVVLLVGVVAGRSKRRMSLLLTGLVAVIVLGVAATAVTGGPDPTRAAAIARLYTSVVPLAVAFLAGWLCGKATWFARLVVIGVAALLLAAFPYAAAGQATAVLIDGPGSAVG